LYFYRFCMWFYFLCKFTLKITEHTVASYESSDFTWKFLTVWSQKLPVVLLGIFSISLVIWFAGLTIWFTSIPKKHVSCQLFLVQVFYEHWIYVFEKCQQKILICKLGFYFVFFCILFVIICIKIVINMKKLTKSNKKLKNN
jgi:hypothetical protein